MREDGLSDSSKGGQMGVRVELDGGPVEAGRPEFVAEGFDHGADLREGHFQMEEQPVSIACITKGLMRRT